MRADMEMLLYLFLLTASKVLGRGLTIDPTSFTTHDYTPQVKTTFFCWVFIPNLQPSVTLYPNSVVVNLHDANTSSLYNSQTLWLVQFYSHWLITNLI